jgi:hypothetical protein
MWNPPDPYEPTSELYRLMPPRRQRSELREALDAATGRDHQDADAAGVSTGGPVFSGPPAVRKGPRKAFPAFFRDVTSNAVGGVLAAAVLALAALLWAHFHHAARPPARPDRPVSTATAQVRHVTHAVAATLR